MKTITLIALATAALFSHAGAQDQVRPDVPRLDPAIQETLTGDYEADRRMEIGEQGTAERLRETRREFLESMRDRRREGFRRYPSIRETPADDPHVTKRREIGEQMTAEKAREYPRYYPAIQEALTDDPADTAVYSMIKHAIGDARYTISNFSYPSLNSHESKSMEPRVLASVILHQLDVPRGEHWFQEFQVGDDIISTSNCSSISTDALIDKDNNLKLTMRIVPLEGAATKRVEVIIGLMPDIRVLSTRYLPDDTPANPGTADANSLEPVLPVEIRQVLTYREDTAWRYDQSWIRVTTNSLEGNSLGWVVAIERLKGMSLDQQLLLKEMHVDGDLLKFGESSYAGLKSIEILDSQLTFVVEFIGLHTSKSRLIECTMDLSGNRIGLLETRYIER